MNVLRILIVFTPAIIVFTKNVRPGAIKREISKYLGEEAACALYRSTLDHTRRLLEQRAGIKYILYDRFINQRDKWDNCTFIKGQQQGADLRERMQQAICSVFARGVKPVIVLAADCPQLAEAHISQALEALKQGKFVLGKTYAGGFYLLGIPQPADWLFGIDWEKGKRASTITEALHAHQQEYVELPTLTDISRVADLQQFSGHPLVAPFLPSQENALN